MQTVFRPIFFSLVHQGLNVKQIGRDVMAGIVVGIVALPLAIAFAVASGVSPEKGIITAIVAGFLISLLGGSRVQIGGPTGAFIVIVYGIVEQYGVQGLLISTVMAGVIMVLMGLLRLGTLLKYFPHPLIVGFTSGVALIIFSTQIKDALGLPVSAVPANFLGKWQVYLSNLGGISLAAVIITGLTILITLAAKKLTKRVPGSFIAIIVITLAVKFFEIPVATIETHFGSIPQGFSFVFPQFEWAQLPGFIGPALTIALLGGIESLLSAVVADGMIGGKHRSNTELVAQGIANIITPFFGGIPATGAIARTATNVKNGGRTPIAGMVHAITLLGIMLFFGAWAKLIPMACLAGILMVVAYNMSEWRSFVAILTSSIFDSLVLLVTFLLTVLVDLTIAIQVGVVLSAVLFMKRMSDISGNRIDHIVDTDVIENYEDLPEGLSVFEISGPLFFASARRYAEVIEEIGLRSRVMIIRMRHVSFIDHTGMHTLKEVLRILNHKGVHLILSGVNEPTIKEMEAHKLSQEIDRLYICDSFEKARQLALEALAHDR